MNPDRTHGLGRRLFANTLHVAGGRLAGLLLWLVFTPAILAELGSERFAIWSLFYALTGYLAALDLGFAQSTLRFVAAARGRGDPDDGGAFGTLAVLGYTALALLWALLAWVAAAPLLDWLRIPPGLREAATFGIRMGAVTFLCTGIANVVTSVAQGHDRFDLANQVTLAMVVLQAAGMALVLARHAGVEGLMLSVAASGGLGAVLGIALLRLRVPEYRWSGVARALRGTRAALRYGLPMQGTNLLAAINAHVDKLLLARFVNLPSVTAYELGSRVASVANSIPQLLLVPVLAESSAMSAAGDHPRLRALHDRGSRHFLTLAAMCLAPLLAAAPRLYDVWLGGAHPEAAWVLRWLTVAAGVSLATGLGTTLARGIGRTELEAWFAVATVSIHIALSLALLPRIGLTGALLASVVSHAAGSVLFLALFARAMRWSFAVVLRPWAEPAAATLLGFGAGALLDRALPHPAGVAGWVVLAVVAGAAAVVALGVAAATRYFPWRDVAGALGRPRGMP